MDQVQECCEFSAQQSQERSTRPLIADILNRYYVLIAACVLARKADWLRNACLAAVLLFPAVAALHGITLAVLHVDGNLIFSTTAWAIWLTI